MRIGGDISWRSRAMRGFGSDQVKGRKQLLMIHSGLRCAEQTHALFSDSDNIFFRR